MATKTMTARYQGTCRECRGTILPGEHIEWRGRGNTRHTDCGDGVIVWRVGDHVGTVNRKGRCIDAPCCGCCT